MRAWLGWARGEVQRRRVTELRAAGRRVPHTPGCSSLRRQPPGSQRGPAPHLGRPSGWPVFLPVRGEARRLPRPSLGPLPGAVLPPGAEFRGGLSLRSGPGYLCPGGAGVSLLSSSKLAALLPAESKVLLQADGSA